MSAEAVAAAVDGVIIHVRPAATPEPLGPCNACHGTDFWASIYVARICRRCHPPAPDAEVVQ